jgi:hypothetical protein
MAVAGCLTPSGEAGWSLNIYSISEQGDNGHLSTQVTIGIGGKPESGLEIHDVVVCALDRNGTVLDSTTIGRMAPDSGSVNATLTTGKPPKRVVIGFQSVNTSQSDFDLMGIKRENETYRDYHQNGPRCGVNASSETQGKVQPKLGA